MGALVSFPALVAADGRPPPRNPEVVYLGVTVGERIAAPAPDGAIDGATVIARGPNPDQVLVRFDRGEARWILVQSIVGVRRDGGRAA
ncbi:MAG: hypothetical protein RLZZ127_2574 [Planctomycetota bacterium]|jgi:hypothetical protein